MILGFLIGVLLLVTVYGPPLARYRPGLRAAPELLTALVILAGVGALLGWIVQR